MYIQGVSTRKVTAILERLCGTSVSATQVSKASALLDETLQSWRQRPLGECPYLVLDARYEKVCQDGQIRDAAVLMACGVDLNGKRQLLGVSASLGFAVTATCPVFGRCRVFGQSLASAARPARESSSLGFAANYTDQLMDEILTPIPIDLKSLNPKS
jgi:hypothetical protein